jgi:hypothetical protein
MIISASLLMSSKVDRIIHLPQGERSRDVWVGSDAMSNPYRDVGFRAVQDSGLFDTDYSFT